MKKHQDFSTSSLDTEEEKAYLSKLFNNYYSKENKKRYATILEDKYQVLRIEKDEPKKSIKIWRIAKYVLGAAACFVLLLMVWPDIDDNRNKYAELVNKYSTTDFLQNREIKRGSAMDDEYRIAAIQSYNKGKYQDALQSYELVKNLNKEDNFWMGMASFYEKDYVTSESVFKDLLLAEDMKYGNELKWYYALSLLQNGKNKQAEPLLKEMNSWKSSEAQELLKALK